jgi:hypothetical protein
MRQVERGGGRVDYPPVAALRGGFRRVAAIAWEEELAQIGHDAVDRLTGNVLARVGLSPPASPIRQFETDDDGFGEVAGRRRVLKTTHWDGDAVDF